MRARGTSSACDPDLIHCTRDHQVCSQLCSSFEPECVGHNPSLRELCAKQTAATVVLLESRCSSTPVLHLPLPPIAVQPAAASPALRRWGVARRCSPVGCLQAAAGQPWVPSQTPAAASCRTTGHHRHTSNPLRVSQHQQRLTACVSDAKGGIRFLPRSPPPSLLCLDWNAR